MKTAIAPQAAERIDEVRQFVAGLRQSDMPEVDQMFKKVLERLDAITATVSVVGQVKAGKSSLINALTGIGDLLPTEVNPWTAVITNLHFGHSEHGDGSGVFQLFSENEWSRMLEGGSESRKLAEELLPGFKSDVLDQQIQEMQEKAQRRLGDLYHFLLGKEHRFNHVTPEILERYVSAGYGDDIKTKSTAGRFSCITKSANVFLAPGRFSMPMTVSDTPGINDPFLVRDEITTSSFSQADVFVVTLSAHQVLNVADIGLIKMLSRHPGKQTIIFVNRIDQLDNPVESVPEVVAGLKNRLSSEMDDSNVLVVPGSAHWGRAAACASEEELRAEAKPDSIAAYLGTSSDSSEEDLRDAFFKGSGLEELIETISKMVLDGRVSNSLGDVVTGADGAVNFLEQALREQLNQYTIGPINCDDIDQLIDAELARIDQRLGMLNGISEQLVQLSNVGRGQLLENCQDVSRSVMAVIQESINSFIDEQVGRCRELLVADGRSDGWSFDTNEVQEKVQEQVRNSYSFGREKMDELLMKFANELREAIGGIAGELEVGRLLHNLPNAEILPAFRPQSSVINVELTTKRGWKFWKSKYLGEEEAAERITRVIRADFYPAVRALEEAVGALIGERNGAALERLQSLLNSATEFLKREISSLGDDATELSSEAGRQRAAAIFEERRRRSEELEQRVEQIESARVHLQKWLPESVDEPAADAEPMKTVANLG